MRGGPEEVVGTYLRHLSSKPRCRRSLRRRWPHSVSSLQELYICKIQGNVPTTLQFPKRANTSAIRNSDPQNYKVLIVSEEMGTFDLAFPLRRQKDMRSGICHFQTQRSRISFSEFSVIFLAQLSADIAINSLRSEDAATCNCDRLGRCTACLAERERP